MAPPPGKKASMAKLGSQQSSVGAASPVVSYARPPLPVPVAPASDTIAPMWTPAGTPREIFPEWPGSAAIAAEQWGSADSPFEDMSVDLAMLPLPPALDTAVQWKRPSQFLPPIVDPTPAAVPALAPVVPDPKHAAAKKGAPAPAAKKGTAHEPEPPKKLAPKYAHIFYVDAHEADTANEHKKPVVPAAAPAGGHGHAAAAPVAVVAAAATGSTMPLAHQLPHIPRGFRRLWSAEELEALSIWNAEEARIGREKENRERVLMAFEDAIAYIVNERPRKLMEDDELDADDLIDDGEDDEDDALDGQSASLDSSPFGVLPPPRIEIACNATPKPEIPHGDVVHREMASYFYIVEQLWPEWTASKTPNTAGSHDAAEAAVHGPPPFLWQAIYPQDARGVPVYNPGGRYAVKLFVLGKWRRVDVDDKLPVDVDGNIVYLTSAMRSEIWAAILTKALHKVLHWLRGSGYRDDHESNGPLSCAVWQTKTILSALTGWNVTRWNQRVTGDNVDSIYQQLREYIPIAQVADDTGDCLVENDAAIDSKTEDEIATHSAGEEQPLEPRALVCCTDSRGLDTSIPLAFREAALVTDIVGEPGNMELKVAQGHGQSISVAEELIAMDQAVVLLLHAPQKHETLVLQQWTRQVDHAANDAVTLVPPANPPVQLLVVHLPSSPGLQAAGDSATELEQQPQTAQEGGSKTDLMVTLTRIHPTELAPVVSELAERQLAQYLGVDPNGSLILMEERFQRTKHVSSTELGSVVLPRLIRLDTTTSIHIPITNANTDHIVFRLAPQRSLGYGYALQCECSEVVELLTPETYWRNRLQLQVVDCEGSYPVLMANSWHVLFKHTIEIAVTEGEPFTELFLDLHVSEALLTPFVHISVVNDQTTEITHAAALCSIVTLPLVATSSDTATSPSVVFTVIVECRLQQDHVREGTWKLVLGSRSVFRASSTHSMVRTCFDGHYEPNKPLICFRDVVTAPKKSIWTSLQVQLFTNEVLREDLAVKLAVFELKSEQLLHESSAMGEIQLLQVPKLPERAQDDAAYVIQCTIDRSRCVVPDELLSVRPFRDSIGSKSPAELKDRPKIDESIAVADEDVVVLAPIPSSRPTQSNLTWQLTCWSAEPVVLEVDRTKEKRFDAVRFMWNENAKDRDTNGSVSRLLFLGHTAAAEAKMRMDNMSDEQIAAARNRLVWLEDEMTTQEANVSKQPEQEQEQYLIYVKSAPEERVLTPEELEEYHRQEQQAIDASRALVQQRREARELAKSQRAQNMKDLVQSVKEKRATAARKRLAQLTMMHQNPPSSTTA